MDTPIIIIGAGLSGLVAARELMAAGHQVLVVDKGRSVGGRLATRRIGSATLDHGAQFFTVRSDAFRSSVDRWIDQGVVSSWCEGFDQVDGYPRYRAAGGMSQLAKHLAAGVDVVTSARVQSVTPGPDAWTITYDGAGRQPDDGRAVIVTTPVPRTLELLASGGTPLGQHADGLRDLSYHQVIALLTTVSRPPDLPDPGAIQQPDDPTFSFVADNQAKGISSLPAITFHTAHQLSSELWGADDEAIRERLLPTAAQLVGLDSRDFTTVQVKKWRYSGPVKPWPDRCLLLHDHPGPLLLAGDAFGGPKVEGAFLSGQTAARSLLELLA